MVAEEITFLFNFIALFLKDSDILDVFEQGALL